MQPCDNVFRTCCCAIGFSQVAAPPLGVTNEMLINNFSFHLKGRKKSAAIDAPQIGSRLMID